MDTVMYLKRLEDFTPEIALKVLKQYISKSNSIYGRLSVRNLNLIKNGICDDRMIKYVCSDGFAIYQIVAVDTLSLKNKNKRVEVTVKFSQI